MLWLPDTFFRNFSMSPPPSDCVSQVTTHLKLLIILHNKTYASVLVNNGKLSAVIGLKIGHN